MDNPMRDVGEWLEKHRDRQKLPDDLSDVARIALILSEAAAPGPWSACHDGECSCKQVWHSDFPVAVITHGDWGDEYPAIRFIEQDGLRGQAVEAFMEKMVYGSVGANLATANAKFIAFARLALPVLAQAVLNGSEAK